MGGNVQDAIGVVSKFLFKARSRKLGIQELITLVERANGIDLLFDEGEGGKSLNRSRETARQQPDLLAVDRLRVGEIQSWRGGQRKFLNEELPAVMECRHRYRAERAIGDKDQCIDPEGGQVRLQRADQPGVELLSVREILARRSLFDRLAKGTHFLCEGG